MVDRDIGKKNVYCRNAFVSKYEIPNVSKRVLFRHSLVNKLNCWEGVLPVCAPAGYGKSLGIAAWARTNREKVSWLSFDSEDNEPEALLRSILLSAFQECLGEEPFVIPFKELGGECCYFDAVSLIAKAVERNTICVFDNLEALTSKESVELLCSFLEAVNKRCKVILIGRCRKDFISITSRIDLSVTNEITADDLALGFSEAIDLARISGLNNVPEKISESELQKYVARLWNATEGWPLFFNHYLAAGIRQRGGRLGLRLTDKADIKKYIRQELYECLPNEVRGFIEDIQELEFFDSSAIDYFSRDLKAFDHLEYLVNDIGLMVKDEWGRFYFRRVFREYLLGLNSSTNSFHEEILVDLTVLSKRELEVLDLMSTGISNAEISERLCRSVGTVKVHVHNIFQKLGVENRGTAISRYNHHVMANASLN